MKMDERRVPRVSRMISEWFREVPDYSGMVPGVSGMVLGIYGRFGMTGRLWKVRRGPG